LNEDERAEMLDFPAPWPSNGTGNG